MTLNPSQKQRYYQSWLTISSEIYIEERGNYMVDLPTLINSLQFFLNFTKFSPSEDVSKTFRGHIGKKTKNSSFEVPWFVYILSSSFHSDIHSNLTILPFTTKTPMEFPPDKGLPNVSFFSVTCSSHPSLFSNAQ